MNTEVSTAGKQQPAPGLREQRGDRKNSKNISRSFSGFVVSIVGSVHFWQFLGPTYISQDL